MHGPGASHLSPDQLTDLRLELEKQLKKLTKSMAVSDEALRPVTLDQTAVGRLSRMDSLQNQSMTRNLHEREQTQFAQVRAALERLANGTYGVCELCDGPIDYGRLMVFPEAESCHGCG